MHSSHLHPWHHFLYMSDYLQKKNMFWDLVKNIQKVSWALARLICFEKHSYIFLLNSIVHLDGLKTFLQNLLLRASLLFSSCVCLYIYFSQVGQKWLQMILNYDANNCLKERLCNVCGHHRSSERFNLCSLSLCIFSRHDITVSAFADYCPTYWLGHLMLHTKDSQSQCVALIKQATIHEWKVQYTLCASSDLTILIIE